ncbi:hypothetical protein BH10ACT6_BH10ACT6_05790 [soil metagenome]
MAQRRATEPSVTTAANRILVVRSGGLAGIRQQWQVEPAEDVAEWSALVAACPWNEAVTDMTSRDRFVWRIEARMPPTILTASVPDAQLIGPWRVLVDRVREVGSHG